MKKQMICGFIAVLILMTLSACESQPSAPSEPADIEQENPSVQPEETNTLYEDAVEILDEFDDPCIDDFKEAYALLMDLPDNKADFVEQLQIVSAIFERNNAEFQYGGWYLQPHLSDESITKDGIAGYKDKQVYYDIRELLERCIYPLIFEKYGDGAYSISGINSYDVISAIEADREYSHSDIQESYSSCSEKWTYNGAPTNQNYQYRVTYHKNGLVEYITIPIVRHDQPMDESVFESFLDFELSEQKKIAENRFASLLEQMDNGLVGYKILRQIYSDEEINIICNYLKSLPPVIWENSIYTEEETETANYAVASVWFQYKGTSIIADFGLNSIQLHISGSNYVNQLSHKWHTVYCGFGYPNDADISQYQDTIDYNLSANTEIPDYKFDLDAHEKDFMGEYPLNSSQDGSNSTSPEKLVLSISDKVTVEGVVEENTDTFPKYRFKLSAPIHVVLKEFDEEFTCEYIYFYDDTELNGGFDYTALVGNKYSITAPLENYRGGGNLYFIIPEITQLS